MTIFGEVLHFIAVAIFQYSLLYIPTIHYVTEDSLALKDGRKFILAVYYFNDIGYEIRRDGFLWTGEKVADLQYSEDHAWISDPGLVVTPDESMILVRRGGIFTDCISVQTMKQCPFASGGLDWQAPEEWIARSERIEKFTGVSAGPAEKRRPYVRP